MKYSLKEFNPISDLKNQDKFGIAVVCKIEDIRKVEEILKLSGADEIQFEGI